MRHIIFCLSWIVGVQIASLAAGWFLVGLIFRSNIKQMRKFPSVKWKLLPFVSQTPLMQVFSPSNIRAPTFELVTSFGVFLQNLPSLSPGCWCLTCRGQPPNTVELKAHEPAGCTLDGWPPPRDLSQITSCAWLIWICDACTLKLISQTNWMLWRWNNIYLDQLYSVFWHIKSQFPSHLTFPSYNLISLTRHVLSTTYRPNLAQQIGALALVDICEQALTNKMK